VRGTRGAPVVTGFLVVLLALVLLSFLLKIASAAIPLRGILRVLRFGGAGDFSA